MRIAVVGTGAIGGYFGGRLAAAGHQVHFLARGATVEAIRANGLRVESVHGDFAIPSREVLVTDDPSVIEAVDVVLFTVKSHDTVDAARSLPPLIGPGTAVISLQNGIDNEDRLAEAIGFEHVVGGVAYILAHVREPGVVVHTGGPARIVVGELDGTSSERAEAFRDACVAAGFPAETTTRIRVELWSKYAFICAQAGLTAASRMPIGVIRETPETWELFAAMVGEAWRVARAERVPVPDDFVEGLVSFAGTLEAHGRSSLYDDMAAGRRMELDALLGELVRRADAVGEPAPVSRTLLAILRPWQRANELGAGRSHVPA
jgi:2-dehydropantoate 2-reductase